LDTSQRRDESRDAELPLARQAFDDLRPKLLELTQEMASQAPSSRIVVDLSDRKVTLWHDDELAETFPIAVGRAGWETPTGEFEVINKNENPVWQNPLTDQIVPAGPNNPLGTRWIGFWTDGRNQIGFHGTIQTDLIGQAVSHGCIRMDNQDIEVLYDQIAIGVPVVISE
ncbi:MAG: L,D-transpeptidase, partial [Cyanobacteria bacterium J06633_2]